MISCLTSFPCSSLQVEPNSIAAKDGRIREGDRILQVRSWVPFQTNWNELIHTWLPLHHSQDERKCTSAVCGENPLVCGVYRYNIKNLYLIISCYSSYYIIIFSSAPSLSVSLWILVLLYKTTCWVRLNRPDQLSFLYIFCVVAVIRLGFCDLWPLCTMRSELQIV